MWDTLGSISGLVKPKTLKLIFATSLGARNAALFSHFKYEFHISIPKSSNQNKLDIAISFMKSVGSDPESSLYHFMSNTLKMDKPFPSPKVI
jgi:hypothetical protein